MADKLTLREFFERFPTDEACSESAAVKRALLSSRTSRRQRSSE